MILGMTDTQAIIVSEVLAFLIGPSIIAFLMRRLMWPWLRVKMSRGAKILIRQITRTQDYFAVGTPRQKLIEFKKIDGSKVQLPYDDENLYDAMGVKCIDFDTINNTTINRKQMSMVNGFAAEPYDELISMAILKGADKMEMYIIAIIVILIIMSLLLCISIYFGYSSFDAIQGLKQIGQQTVTQGGI